ncbi:MAG TPA: hypothetical protein DCL21_07330 [Alphaproteobacteria bacterium]|nr:hypothetical protein [Alphaproteobacteria bacterium]
MKYKYLLPIAALMCTSCAYRTVELEDEDGKEYNHLVSNSVYIDFGTPEKPSDVIGFYSAYVSENYDYFRYESKLKSFGNKKQINKKPQMICLGKSRDDYRDFLHCTQSFQSKPKRAYGKWYVSKEFFIKNHGLYVSFASDGLKAAQLSQYKKDGTYETIVHVITYGDEFLK